ncbi:MAG: pyruvate dehydrogenase (acetyl-transferring) E1 component subunit alpha [bacterium]
MPRKTVYDGNVEYLQILTPDGELDEELLEFELDDDFLVNFYKKMKKVRVLDEKALKLQRQGRLGTYAPCKGQEACQVGSILAIEDKDFIFPSYRESGVFMTRGIPIEHILLYWGGDERGNTELRPHRVFPVSIPVGSQPIHAVGAMKANTIQDKHNVAITYFGDGSTSEGDMLESMNFAGVWDTPVLFFCQNNQWAISVPREDQTASETLAQKSHAFGFDGVQIDGNDPLIVYQTVKQVRETMVEEATPYFIEAITFRRGDHTTADDASKYRTEQEEEKWIERDPLKRTRTYLEKNGVWDEDREQQLEEECEREIEKGVEAYEDYEKPDPGDIFQYTYEEMTSPLEQQYESFLQEKTSE